MRKQHILLKLFILPAAAIALFPILFTFANSLMSSSEVTLRYTAKVLAENSGDVISHNIHFVRFGLFPDHVTLQQYDDLFHSSEYLRMFWNSVVLVIPILVGQCVLAPLAAYGLENIRWKYKEVISFSYVIVMLMPLQILLVPNYIVAGWLHIRESYLAIILPAVFHPLGIFLIRQQLKNFPKDCQEAAKLDGATAFQIYRLVVRPNLSQVVAAMLVLLFADNWNIVDQALVFLKGRYDMPLSVFLSSVVIENPGIFFAVSVFYMIPALLVFLLGQDALIKGITLSSLKA